MKGSSRLPLNGLHYSYLGNLFAKPLLDSHFQRHLGHWATSASTRQLDPDCAFVGHFYKFQVASILLQGGPYSFRAFSTLSRNITSPPPQRDILGIPWNIMPETLLYSQYGCWRRFSEKPDAFVDFRPPRLLGFIRAFH